MVPIVKFNPHLIVFIVNILFVFNVACSGSQVEGQRLSPAEIQQLPQHVTSLGTHALWPGMYLPQNYLNDSAWNQIDSCFKQMANSSGGIALVPPRSEPIAAARDSTGKITSLTYNVVHKEFLGKRVYYEKSHTVYFTYPTQARFVAGVDLTGRPVISGVKC